MQNKIIKACLISAIFFAGEAASNADVIGTTYPVAEKSLLEEIMGKLKAMEASGEIAARQEDMKKIAIESINNPKGTRIKATKDAQTHYFDPSIRVDKDIMLPDGRVLHKAGTVVNPLTIKSFSKRMIFIDGKDPKQVAWGKKQFESSGWRDKLILVDGSYMDIMRDLKGKQVYFDQVKGMGGAERETLAKKFGIKSVPSVVYQQGNLLRIDAIRLP